MRSPWKIVILLSLFLGHAGRAAASMEEGSGPSKYYELLGLNSDATEQDIRRAYRRLALLTHPDKSSDPDAHARFLALNNAYEVLRDPKTRKSYDQGLANEGFVEAEVPSLEEALEELINEVGLSLGHSRLLAAQVKAVYAAHAGKARSYRPSCFSGNDPLPKKAALEKRLADFKAELGRYAQSLRATLDFVKGYDLELSTLTRKSLIQEFDYYISSRWDPAAREIEEQLTRVKLARYR